MSSSDDVGGLCPRGSIPQPPIDPGPSGWTFPAASDVEDDLVAIGADLEPNTLLAAYRRGLFPMGLGSNGSPPIGWWSPQVRGVLRHGDFHVSRSLHRSARAFEVTSDRAFSSVVQACADPSRAGRWISAGIAQAYGRLHELGWAHSVEVWRGADLVGGLYGVAIGGLFAGESMFHRATDASKVALWALANHMYDDESSGLRIIDVQWSTPHLASLGVTGVSRRRYGRVLARAIDVPWRSFHAQNPRT